jgi:hypothetical protein
MSAGSCCFLIHSSPPVPRLTSNAQSAAIATMEQTLMELEEKLIHEKTETYLVKLSEKVMHIL